MAKPTQTADLIASIATLTALVTAQQEQLAQLAALQAAAAAKPSRKGAKAEKPAKPAKPLQPWCWGGGDRPFGVFYPDGLGDVTATNPPPDEVTVIAPLKNGGTETRVYGVRKPWTRNKDGKPFWVCWSVSRLNPKAEETADETDDFLDAVG
jgi:hypothetical protein